jgi:hypothetical protein
VPDRGRAAPAARRAGLIRASGRLLIGAASSLLVGLLVLGSVLAWRLSQGPVEVDALTPEIERALGQAGVNVEIADTVVTWGGPGALFDLRARGVNAFDAEGRLLASVPELGIAFDLRRLLRAELAPTRLDLMRPRIRAQRTAEGEVRFDIAAQGGMVGTAPGEMRGTGLADALVEALERPPGEGTGPLSELREVVITGADLRLDDEGSGWAWHAPRADLALRRGAGGLSGSARIDLELGTGLARLSADLRRRAAEGITTVNARISDLRPADLALLDPVLAPLAAVSLVMTGTATARFDQGFRTLDALLHLKGTDGEVNLPDLYPAPLPVASAELRTNFDAAARRIVVDGLDIDLGGPTARLAAVLTDLGGRRIGVDGTADLAAVPVDDLDRLWPAAVAPNARNWITENLSAGTVDRTTARLSAVVPVDEPGAAAVDRAEAEFAFTGVEVRYFGELPHVTGVDGTARLDRTRMDLDLAGGRLRDLAVGRSRIEITGLDTKDEHIDMELPLAGPLRTVLEVLDMPPLGYPKRLGFDAAGSSGKATGTLGFTFPLKKDLDIEEVVFSAKARLAEVALDGLVPGRRVSDGAFTLALDPLKLTAEGTARLDGVPAEVSWRENFPDDADFSTRIAAKAVLGEADRRRLGFDTAPWVRGAVAVDAVFLVPKPGQRRVTAGFDLSRADIDLEPLGWSKPAGAGGTAELELAFTRDGPVRMPSFSIRAGDLSARGSMDLGTGGPPSRISLAELALGGTRLKAEAVALLRGGYRVFLDGPSLDLRPLLRDDVPAAEDEGEKAEEGPGFPLEIELGIGRVVVADGKEIAELKGHLRNDGTRWTEADLAARAGRETPVTLSWGAEGKLRRLRVRTADTGAVLRSLDVFDTMRGGRLLLEATAPADDPEAPLEGTIELVDFTLVEAPVLARLLNAASPSGFAELLGGDGGISFARMVGDWRWQENRIHVARMRTSGAALGLTLEGVVDLDTDRMDLQGTIVPVAGVNRFLGAIPLLGQLLTGGEGHGVFAFTYAAQGPLGDPRITVNPLAVLAPGFLRNLFFLGPVPGDEPRR